MKYQVKINMMSADLMNGETHFNVSVVEDLGFAKRHAHTLEITLPEKYTTMSSAQEDVETYIDQHADKLEMD